MSTKAMKKSESGKVDAPVMKPFQLSNVCFPSLQDQTYRVNITKAKTEGYTFNLENKKTHEQWQCVVSEIHEHGPNLQIPHNVFLSFMSAALESLDIKKSKVETPSGNSTADIYFGEKGLVVVLKIIISPFWVPEYSFNMTPVGLEVTDMISAQLRDVQEDLASLKSPNVALAISSNTSCSYGQIVQWDGTVPRLVSDTFQISADNCQITITKSGLYFLNIRLGETSSGNGCFLSLLVNEVDYAKCVNSSYNSNQNTAQLTEVLMLKVGDILQVRCGANSGSLADQTMSRFTMYLMHG